jgi:predicted nucleotidyltransferase
MLGEIEEAAKRELPDTDYLTVYLSSHDLPKGPKDCAPGTVCRECFGGRQVELVWPAWKMRSEDPAAWYGEVLKLVRDPKVDVKRRSVLIFLLGEESDSNDAARAALKQVLTRDRSPEIRAACAEALQSAASAEALQGAAPAKSAIIKLLLDHLDKDKSDIVRERCAEALRDVAPNQTEVRNRLEALFTSGPELVRAGAAKGLSRLDFTSRDQKALLKRLLATIASPAEPTCVRFASIWAIATLLGRNDMRVANQVAEECLDDHNRMVSTAALHVLADALAEERREWSQPLVEKIEAMLMAVTTPCPHLYGDLVKIVAMKEIRCGQRLERLLGDALTSFGDLIKIAFVFGSVGRVEQVRDSDIDLMIIGAVRLKDVAAALHAAEQTLGRTVNPVLFVPEKLREQYRAGNPFLLDVVRKEKIFLKGNRDELTELVAERAPD